MTSGFISKNFQEKAIIEIQEENEKLHRELNELKEEFRAFEDANRNGKLQQSIQKFHDENSELRERLKNMNAIEIRADDYAERYKKSEEQIRQLKLDNNSKSLELEKLSQDARKTIEEYQVQLTSMEAHIDKSEGNELFLEQTVADMQTELKNRDETIYQLNEQVKQLTDGSLVSQLHIEIDQLSLQLGARTEENQTLHTKLQELMIKYEDAINELSDYDNMHEEKLNAATASAELHISNLTTQVEDLMRSNELLASRNEVLEGTANEHSEKQAELLAELTAMYKGKGVEDFVLERHNLKVALQRANSNLSELAVELNRKDNDLERIEEENIELRKLAKVPSDWHLDANDVVSRHRRAVSEQKAEVERYASLVSMLEEQKTKLLDQLRQKALVSDEGGVMFLGLHPGQMKRVEEYAERLRDGDDTLPIDNQSQALKEEVKLLRNKLDILSERNAELEVSRSDALEKYTRLVESRQDQTNKKLQDLYSVVSELKNVPAAEKTSHSIPQKFKQSEVAVLAVPFSDSSQDTKLEVKEKAEPTEIKIETNEAKIIEEVSKPHGSISPSLVGCMYELKRTNEQLHVANEALTKQRDVIGTLMGQSHALYQDFKVRQNDWDKKETEMKARLADLNTQHEIDQATIGSYNDRISTSKLPQNEKDSKLEEYNRTILLLQVQQKKSARKTNAITNEYALLKTKYADMSNDFIEMESTLKTRINQLDSCKQLLESKVSFLSDSLKNWIPVSDYNRLSRQFETLSKQHSDLIERDARSTIQLEHINESMSQLRLAKHDCEHYRQKYEEVSNHVAQLNLAFVSHKAAQDATNHDEIELKLRSELALATAKADSYNKQIERFHTQFSQQNDYASSIEKQLSALEVKLFSMQESLNSERETVLSIKNKFEGSVSIKTSEEMEKRIRELMAILDEHKIQLNEQRVAARIASQQSQQLLEKEDTMREELETLHKTLNSFEERGDEKNIIGKLEHELLHRRISEKEAKDALLRVNNECTELRNKCVKLELQSDDLHANLFRKQQQYRESLALNRVEANEVSISKSASLSFQQADILRQTCTQMELRLAELRKVAQETDQALLEKTLQHDRISIELDSASEILDLVKKQEGDSHIQRKIFEWGTNVRQLRLVEMQLKHEVSQLNSKIVFQNESLTGNAQTIDRLHAQVLDMEHEMRSVEQRSAVERREIAAKSVLSASQALHMNKESALAASRVAITPVQSRVQFAIPEAIKEEHEDRSDEIAHLQIELSDLKIHCEDLTQKLTYTEGLLVAKEQHLAATRSDFSEIQKKYLNLTTGGTEAALEVVNTLNSEDRKRHLDIAISNVENLQMVLAQKNDTIAKYEAMLHRNQEKHRMQCQTYQDQIEELSERMAELIEIQDEKNSETLQAIARIPSVPDKVVAIERFEETMGEKNHEINVLHSEIDSLQTRIHSANRKIEELASANDKLQHTHQLLSEKQAAVAQLEAEMAATHAKNRTDSGDIQKQVNELQEDLLSKNEQIQCLNTVIIGLKEEMVRAQQNTAETGSAMVANSMIKANELQIEAAHVELISLQKKLGTAEQNARKFHNELVEERSKVASLTECVQKLKQDHRIQIHTLKANLDKSEKKQEPIKATRVSARPISHHHDDLSQKVNSLEAQLNEAKRKDTARWESQKKLEKRAERLKQLLDEKSEHLSKVETQLERIKSRPTKQVSSKSSLTLEHVAELQELSARCLHLGEYNADLKRQLEVDNQSVILSLAMERESLLEKIRVYELKEEGGALEPDDQLDALNKAHEAIDHLQAEFLASQKELLSLKYSDEQRQVVEDSLRLRISELERYNNAGKALTLKSLANNFGLVALVAQGADPKNQNEVVVLEALVEKLSSENENLNKQAQINSDYTKTIARLRKEVASLKSKLEQVEEARSKISQNDITISRLNELNKQLQRRTGKAQVEINGLEAANAKQSEKITSLKNSNDLLKERIHELSDQANSVTAQSDELEKCKIALSRQETIISDAKNKMTRAENALKKASFAEDAWKQLTKDRDQLAAENASLKEELSALTPDFFDELENLKYRYSISVESLSQLRIKYEEALSKIRLLESRA